MHLRKAAALLAFAAALPATPGAGADRPPVNEKPVPPVREDVDVIQKHLSATLPAARKATVCLEFAGGSGSGVIVSADGLILTAAHVPGGLGRELTVIFEDGRRAKAESLGLVASSDCAMVRITEKGVWPHVEIDRDEASRPGDWVCALGYSGGFDRERGVVVRLGRIVRISQRSIQTDCPLSGGDSGGPLFDLGGRLIAIHSRTGGRTPGNLHVPVREFLKNWDGMLASEFIGEGEFAKRPEKGKGFLGISTEARTEGGLNVTRVGRESPAERAGMRQGDVVLKVDGVEMRTHEQLQDLLKDRAPDDRLAFELLREGKPESVTLRLGER